MQHTAERGDPRAAPDVRTLAVDDHPGFRETLQDLIASTPGFALAGFACSGEEAVRAVERLCPQLVLMDIVMPGMDGIAAARVIVRRDLEVFVVLISAEDPMLYAAAVEFGETVACARKQELGPKQLSRVWQTHIS